MNEHQKHEMILDETYPSGAEEWYCPLCDRRLFVMNWHPDGKQIVLKHGDERSHSPIMKQENSYGMASDTSELGSEDHLRSAFWSKWLDEAGFEKWWDSPLE